MLSKLRRTRQACVAYFMRQRQRGTERTSVEGLQVAWSSILAKGLWEDAEFIVLGRLRKGHVAATLVFTNVEGGSREANRVFWWNALNFQGYVAKVGFAQLTIPPTAEIQHCKGDHTPLPHVQNFLNSLATITVNRARQVGHNTG